MTVTSIERFAEWPRFVDTLSIRIHRQIITNKIENEFVDIVINGSGATGCYDALLPGAGMPAGRGVSEGDQLVDFKVDSTGIALRAKGESGQI